MSDDSRWTCPNCGKQWPHTFDYCPDCDLEDDDELSMLYMGHLDEQGWPVRWVCLN